MLAQPDTEAITAWAPGIYPRLPKARYAIARRKTTGDSLESTFISLLEPYGRTMAGYSVDAADMQTIARISGGELKFIRSLGVLLWKADAIDNEMTWPFEVEKIGDYEIALSHFQSPAYGTVQVSIDGTPVGDPINGHSDSVQAAPVARLIAARLEAGQHEAKLTFTKDDGTGRFWFGTRALMLIPAGEAESSAPRPFIAGAQRLACDDETSVEKPAGLRVSLDDKRRTVDTILTAGDADALRAFADGDETWLLQGRFAHMRFRDGVLTSAHLVGSKRVSVGTTKIVCEEAEHSGDVTDVDEKRAIVDVNKALPTDGRLNGEIVLFGNPRYSRNTAHRIARIEATPKGSRIYLESPSLILGTGILEDDPISEQEFASLLQHEYATSDSVDGTQFFSGKLIKGDGFATTIIRTNRGQLMGYRVDSTAGMSKGSRFAICDVQAQDEFTIVTTAYLVRGEDGTWTGGGTTGMRLVAEGKEIARIDPVVTGRLGQ